MKNTIKMLGIITLAAVINFSMAACSDSSDSTASFNISGSFASQNNGTTKAKFYASESDSRSARSVEDENALEGLLEDGDITFRLKGHYNSESGFFILSAASSFLRYSISGNFNSDELGKAIVQIKTGDNWTSVEVNVDISTNGSGKIKGSGKIEEDFSGGIPENMWGIWYGAESIMRGPDIIRSGDYRFTIDAFTIVLYVNRGGFWNLERYNCFFSGFEKKDGVETGIVFFEYIDEAKLNEENPDYWSKLLYKFATDKNIGTNSSEYGYLALVENGNLSEKTEDEWNTFWANLQSSQFFKDLAAAGWQDYHNKYWQDNFYEKYRQEVYRRDAYKLENGTLRMGVFYQNASGDKYFDENLNVVKAFTDLRWETNTFSK